MSTPIEHDFQVAANRIAQAFTRLIEAVIEAEQRLRYSGDTFNDQGFWSRANACWAAADALPKALAPLLAPNPQDAVTAPATGTPYGQQNRAETVVTSGATGQASTNPDGGAISRARDMLAEWLHTPNEGDPMIDCLLGVIAEAHGLLAAAPALPLDTEDGFGAATIGKQAIGHLREMYRPAFDKLGASGRVSLRNFIDQRVGAA
ncbi:hypothetical protein HOY34_11180 [Xinfangfangia sp. D13-10-4-6]|uniref:hypothetical protein n=1 Tax=Pseudogemmobacter hezensis TaxID=2737662 RepID=UPI0015525181|nr:hypothetical protein [Pseudogemmobacter hezensis]NPD15765.1 hypothetical protein [Pseudogemmobacter hezensis]